MSQDLLNPDTAPDESDSDPSPQERYKMALGTLLDGVVWPALRGRSRVAQHLKGLHKLRHLRALGEESMLYPMTAPSTSHERLELAAEQARHSVMRSRPLLRDFLPGLLLEMLRQHAPLLSADGRLTTAQGLRGPDFDLALEAMGFKLGERFRARALRQLESAGVVVENTARRWNARAGVSDPVGLVSSEQRARLCFLSNLDQVVVQRYMGLPGALWFAGFGGTPRERHAMRLQVEQASQEWLQKKAVRLLDVHSGMEAELVWVNTGLMVGTHADQTQALPDWLLDELEVSVLAGVQGRLGLEEAGIDLLKRALVDRESRSRSAEEQQRQVDWQPHEAGSPVLASPGLSILPISRARWQRLPSFESADQDRHFERGKLPAIALHVQALLQAAYPEARSIYQLYEAAQRQWPAGLCDIHLIERACLRLQAQHLIAESAVPAPPHWSGRATWARGYKSLHSFARKPVPSPARGNRISACLMEFLNSVAAAPPSGVLQFSHHQGLLYRTDVPLYLAHIENAWMESLNRVDIDVPAHDDPHIERSLTCVQVGLAPLKNLSR